MLTQQDYLDILNVMLTAKVSVSDAPKITVLLQKLQQTIVTLKKQPDVKTEETPTEETK